MSCIYFVGLSGSGKTTLAKALKNRIEKESVYVTLLDGDIVRTNISKGLGFSREDRSINVRRIGFVAAEIVKHGGIVICASIAPYEDDRLYNRQLFKTGKYIEVFVDTPLAVCETRDTKGLYKLARSGVLNQLTGVNDPFERPNSDLVVDGSDFQKINDHVDTIIEYIS